MGFASKLKNAYESFTNNDSPTISIDPSTGNKTYFYPLMGGFDYNLSTKSISGQLRAFYECPPIADIIIRKLKAHQNEIIKYLDENKKEVVNKDVIRIKNLIEKPNILQNRVSFETQSKLYKELFGKCYIMPVYPNGYELLDNNSTIKQQSLQSLWVIPNWLVNELKTGRYNNITDKSQLINHYMVSFGNEVKEIRPDNMIVSYDIYPRPDMQIDSFSKLTPLEENIKNIKKALVSRGILSGKPGGIGILSNNTKDTVGTINIDPKEKENIQNNFKGYGLEKGLSNVIVTNSALQWQAMSFPTKDLMLFEEIEDDTRTIADMLGYPIDLLGFKRGSSLSNGGEKNEAQKALYNNSIIPESLNYWDSINEFFNTENLGFTITPSFNHLEIFQKAIKETAIAFNYQVKSLSQAYLDKAISLQTYTHNLKDFIQILEGNENVL